MIYCKILNDIKNIINKLPSEQYEVLRKAPGGDPYEVRVGSTTEIAIRKSEASLVDITQEPLPDA